MFTARFEGGKRAGASRQADAPLPQTFMEGFLCVSESSRQAVKSSVKSSGSRRASGSTIGSSWGFWKATGLAVCSPASEGSPVRHAGGGVRRFHHGGGVPPHADPEDRREEA